VSNSNAALTSTYHRILVIAVPPSRLNGTVCKRFHYGCWLFNSLLVRPGVEDRPLDSDRGARDGQDDQSRCAAGFANTLAVKGPARILIQPRSRAGKRERT